MSAGKDDHEARTALRGRVFDIQPFSLHDGPGIRTTVFLKGCPLHCPWCHNPESWKATPQIAWSSELCVGCGACITACPAGLHQQTPDGHVYHRENCRACGRCVKACPSKALLYSGREMTVEQVMDRILADREFYAGSGGGMTISGGEPLTQAAFAVALLDVARDAGLHVAVETSGGGSIGDMQAIAARSDLVLFDIKASPDDYLALTGMRYGQVESGLGAVKSSGNGLWFRLPMIPGVNDSSRHLENVATLAGQFMPARIELIPYHELGTGKRARFGLDAPPLSGMRPPESGQVRQWIACFHALGVDVQVPGMDGASASPNWRSPPPRYSGMPVSTARLSPRPPPGPCGCA